MPTRLRWVVSHMRQAISNGSATLARKSRSSASRSAADMGRKYSMRMKNSPPSGLVVYWSERTMFAPASNRKPDTALTIPARSAHEMRSRVIAGRSAT